MNTNAISVPCIGMLNDTTNKRHFDKAMLVGACWVGNFAVPSHEWVNNNNGKQPIRTHYLGAMQTIK